MIYSFIYKPVTQGWDSLKEIREANTKIENQEAYEPPEDGQLTEEQVTRFVSVQKELNNHLEQTLEKMQNKYAEKEDDWDEGDMSMREKIQALSDAAQLYADAKNIQVETLNENDFSLDEYHFVRQAFYQALEMELIPYNFDAFANAIDREKLNTDIDLENFRAEKPEFSEEALENNRELVSEYADKAEEWLRFAWWGL